MTDWTINELERIAAKIRGEVVSMSYRGKAPHLGSALSCVDILVAAYWGGLNIDPQHPGNPDRDRLILSKGHAAQALYASLAYRGFFDADLLATYNQNGSCLAEHPGPRCLPGIEAATGSLGHGLPIGAGIALSGQMRGRAYRVLVVSSDGECNEGSMWEAAAFAAARSICNLCVIVDNNGWQATGRSADIMGNSPLADKWTAFGWETIEINGNEIDQLNEAFKYKPGLSGKPFAIIANTVKGKGISFMEDDNNWHYRIPTQEEVLLAKRELGLK